MHSTPEPDLSRGATLIRLVGLAAEYHAARDHPSRSTSTIRCTTGLPPVLLPSSIHRRCSLAFGCEANSKLDQPDSPARWVSAAVKTEAALMEERRQPAW